MKPYCLPHCVSVSRNCWCSNRLESSDFALLSSIRIEARDWASDLANVCVTAQEECLCRRFESKKNSGWNWHATSAATFIKTFIQECPLLCTLVLQRPLGNLISSMCAFLIEESEDCIFRLLMLDNASISASKWSC
jgi:hypothetical protein